MKFAKKLAAELYPEWVTQYLDYKVMKKILKQDDDPDLVQSFCHTLELQVAKVHLFMCTQQQLLSKVIDPLEWLVNDNATWGKPDVSGCCQAIVSQLQRFRNYAALNQLACRKIIKKFNKRLNCRIDAMLHLPVPAERFITATEVDSMLLTPAKNCLRLIMAVYGDVERPMKQFRFWVGELKAGRQLAAHRVSGDFDEISNSLALRENQDQLFVKNTFLTVPSQRSELNDRRSRSQSPRLSVKTEHHEGRLSWDSTAPSTPSADPFGSDDCSTPFAERHFEATDDSASDQAELETIEMSAQQPALVSGEHTECLLVPYLGSHGALSRAPKLCSKRCPQRVRSAVELATAPTMQSTIRTSDNSQHEEAGSGLSCSSPTTRGSSRWWVEADEVCPLSGFPIAHLPYPPFKFQLNKGATKESVKLIDGPFLALQVLSTWNFEVFGQQLKPADIESLDKYMKRCKLGPFRLGKALELFRDLRPESQSELEELRQNAGKKLDRQKHIQRVRFARIQQLGDQTHSAPALPKAPGVNALEVDSPTSIPSEAMPTFRKKHSSGGGSRKTVQERKHLDANTATHNKHRKGAHRRRAPAPALAA